MAIPLLCREPSGNAPGSLLLLACGLCRHMWSINALVACTPTSLTGLGVVFYMAIVIAGMSLYACPFQTPTSIALHGLWKKVQGGIAVMSSRRTGAELSPLSFVPNGCSHGPARCGTGESGCSSIVNLHQQFHSRMLMPNPVNPSSSKSFLTPDDASQPVPPPLPGPSQPEPRLTQKELGIVCRTNTSRGGSGGR